MLEKIKAALAAFKAKVADPKTHRGIALLLFISDYAVPKEYQGYVAMVCGVLALFGYVLPDGTQKKVNALIASHEELANIVLPIANDAGLDTSRLEQTASVPALQTKPAPVERAAPATP